MNNFGCKTPVSILQEYMVAKRQIPSYELILNGVGSHTPQFIYRVSAGDLFADGKGTSKQQAKHNAAQALIDVITASTENNSDTRQLTKALKDVSLPQDNLLAVNAVGQLTEYCGEKCHPEPVYTLVRDEGPPHQKIFTYKCAVSNLSELGTSRTKKQAKHHAAYAMLAYLKSTAGEEFNAVVPVCPGRPVSSPQKKQSDNSVNETYFELSHLVKRKGVVSKFISEMHKVITNFEMKSETLRKIVLEPNEVVSALRILEIIAEEMGTSVEVSAFPDTEPILYYVKLCTKPIICRSSERLDQAAHETLRTLLDYFK